MASLDSLPADQRAVLQLVLQQGRSYDDIAQLLSIDRGAVRDRALAALDALGPQTQVAPQRRALITDYLLGQLPPRVGEDTRDHLAQSAGEREWARVIASELAPLPSQPLPAIPGEDPQVATEPPGVGEPGLAEPHPSSVRGGSTLLALGALIVVVVVVIVIATSSSGPKHSSGASRPATTPTAASTSSTTSGTRVLSRFNMVSPTKGSRAAGIADVVLQGSVTGIAIIARGVTPNTRHDAYAVWVYNSRSDSHLLGFVSPNVGANGRLQTVGPLPPKAGHYKQLLVTLETQQNPSTPGKVVLQGALTGAP